jgi:hypothetical protein
MMEAENERNHSTIMATRLKMKEITAPSWQLV